MNRTTHNKDNRLDRLLRQVVPIENAERGQMLLIMAVAMVGLLVAVGLAVDGGVLFARKAQLDRATDAAALVGVVELANPSEPTDALHSAHTRARQFLGANGIVVWYETDGSPTNPCSTVDWDAFDFCGEIPPDAGSIPGTVRYGIEVRWQAEVYFMQLIGFHTVQLRSKAVAEYFPLVDIFTSPTAENGLIRVTNQSIFGPEGCAKNGDPRTPVHLAASSAFPPNMQPAVNYNDLKGVYTYRITVPASFFEDKLAGGQGFTQLRVELFDPDSGNQVWNGEDDPESYDPVHGIGVEENHYGQYLLFDQNGHKVTDLQPCLDQKPIDDDPDLLNNKRINSCLIDTGTAMEELNPFWIIRVDESRDSFGEASANDYCTTMQDLLPYHGGGGYTDSRIKNTLTLYRLYYYQQTDSGGLEEVDLAYYFGKPDPSGGTNASNPIPGGTPFPANEYFLTDLMWVSPGSPERAPEFSYKLGVEHDNPVIPESELSSEPEPVTTVENCDLARRFLQGTNGSPPITPIIPDIVKATKCEGDENFTVNLPSNPNSEVPDIFIDPTNGSLDIFLQVIGIRGASENGFEIWAGPTPSELNGAGDPNPYVPSEVNARNMFYMAHETENPHSSRGVTLTGLGHLNMNYNSEDPAELPLAYLGPQFAGANMTIRLFDPDGGAGPIVFYMDSIPQSDWVACYPEPAGYPEHPVRSCQWYFDNVVGMPGPVDNGYVYTIDWPIRGGPISEVSPEDKWRPNTNGRFLDFDFTLPGDTVPFYGGRLMVHYDGAANDTINWSILIESRPLLIE